MDSISLLPNDFLLHILSLLPTKDVLTTSLLSKRWRYLWKLVPKLEYIDGDMNVDHVRFLLFVDRSLLLNAAPVLESLHFRFGRHCRDVDIGFWIGIAVERDLRELNFDNCHYSNELSRLPQSLYTCGTLVVLKLNYVSLVDVQFPVCFQLLKTLHLVWVIFLDDESPKKLLACCPVLEVLKLVRDEENDNVMSFSVMVPSLQRFIYYAGSGSSELVMNTPSLKYFETSDLGRKCMIEYMPEIMEAHVEVTCSNTHDILRSLTSVKRLLLCLPSEPRFPTGSIFHQLEHLELCTCETKWNLLMFMLKHSPKLRSLKLNVTHGRLRTFHWEEPSSVPETLKFVLETFEWRNYRGWKREREFATYILKHSRRLKIAKFSPSASTQETMEYRTTLGTNNRTTLRMKFRMITELARLSRGSTECELLFV